MHQLAVRIFWVVVGISVAIHAYQIGIGELNHPGPGFIFFLAGMILAVLGSFDLVGDLARRSETSREEPSLWSGIRWQKVLLVLAVLSAYVFFLNILGFVLDTLLVMLFLYKAVEPTKWWVAFIGSVITILISIGIFQIWLKVPFPKGFVGF
jgi:hypothetical protein